MSLADVISTYCAAWNEPDPGRRRALLEASIAPDAVYVDPTVSVTGIDALTAHIDAVAARRPGARIEQISGVDAHHEFARFGWHLVLADGSAQPDSIDVVEIGTDGKLTRIIGFFGPIPGHGA